MLSGFARFDIDHQGAERPYWMPGTCKSRRVTAGVGEEETKVEYRLSEPNPLLGSGTCIPLAPETAIATVYYSTSGWRRRRRLAGTPADGR